MGAVEAGQETTHGFAIRVPAMSPSTITPSTGPPAASRAQARAPAKPVVAPDVETSTSVLRSWRERRTRASSSSVAVPERSARPVPSRWASTTIRRLDSPGRSPITVTSDPSPIAVRPSVTVRRTANAARSPASSGAANTCATRSASPASPAEPALRSGKAAAMPCRDCGSGVSPLPNARSALNTSEGRRRAARVRAVLQSERGHEQRDQRR